MKSNTSSRSGLFLMELIISILFFSLAGAVCVKLFVNSHIISKNSVELNHALEWSQNMAEVFYACNGDITEMAAIFQAQNANCTLFEASESLSGLPRLDLLFQADFSPHDLHYDSDTISYIVSAAVEEKDQLLYCHITVCSYQPDQEQQIQDPIYELTVSLYPQKEVQP